MSGEYITTGFRNTTVGRLAGGNIATGSYNIMLGYNAEPSGTAVGQCVLGDSNIATLRCNTQSISSLSDRRDKTDIVDLPVGLDFINTLQPRKFKWETREGNIKDGLTRTGFIAQEVKESQKESEYLDLVFDENPEVLEVKQTNLIPILVQAIKDLSAENTELKSRLDAAGL